MANINWAEYERLKGDVLRGSSFNGPSTGLSSKERAWHHLDRFVKRLLDERGASVKIGDSPSDRKGI